MISLIGMKLRPNKSVAAFTLIELFLVVLLLSVIVSLSTPMFRRTFSELSLKNTAFTISKLANYSQEMAIIDRVSYRMNLDYKNGKFWLAKFEPKENTYKKLTNMYGKVFAFPESSNASGPKDVTFNPDGRCDEAEIRITDAHGTGYAVRTQGFGRRVAVEDITK